VVCAIPGEVEEGERYHIMANHDDIQPALSTLTTEPWLLLQTKTEFSSATINYGASTKEIVFSWALVCLSVNKQNYARTTPPDFHTTSVEMWNTGQREK